MLLRRLLIVAPAAALLALMGVTLFTASPAARLGGPAPPFELPDVREPSRSLSLAGLRGRPAVLNFWASWCEPCREEAPELARVSEGHPGVAFLGVNILDGRQDAIGYLDRYGLRYPSVRDATGRVAKEYAVTGVPETVFVDARGRVAGKFIGAFAEGQLAAIVERLETLPPGETLDIAGRGRTKPIP